MTRTAWEPESQPTGQDLVYGDMARGGLPLTDRALMKATQIAWDLRTRVRPPRCPICEGTGTRRVGYGRPFVECARCGFLWCHDSPEWVAARGMGLVGSWGGPEKGGERDDFMVRLLNDHGRERRKVLIYGAGTTLVFRVLHDEGFDVYGADIGSDVVAYRNTEFPGRFFHASEIEKSAHGFDIITACEVFEHMHDPVRWINALSSNLAPDGVLCGSTNFYPGDGPIEDGQRIGYMSVGGHVAYWSESALDAALRRLHMQVVVFELVCPGSVKPDLAYGSLFPNKRLFFGSRDAALIERLRALKAETPILPCDTSDYPVPAYRHESAPLQPGRAQGG